MLHHFSAPQAPNRVVVVGAHGFIGRHLVSHWEAGGIAVLPLASTDLNLLATDAAAALTGMLRENDTVVFLAALTPDKGRGLDTFMDNLRMAGAATAAIEHVKPRHVVYISSDAVYSFDHPTVSETTPAEPVDLYGAMHRARELMFAQAAGMDRLAIVRPTLVYGYGDTHNSYGPNRLRRMARNDGKIKLFGHGEETRDHIWVEDLVRLLDQVVRRGSTGLLNAATGTSVSYSALARIVADLFDGPVAVEVQDRNNTISIRYFDPSALKAAFPDFAFTPLADGLAKVHAQMLANVADD